MDRTQPMMEQTRQAVEQGMSPDQRFAAFMSSYAMRTVDHRGMSWSIYDAGDRKADIVLFLTGGLKKPFWSFSIIDLLQDQFRVIAPAYPPLMTIGEILDGLNCILDDAGVSEAFVMGQSWGGSLASAYALRHSSRVRRLILASTGMAEGAAVTSVLRLNLWLAGVLPKQTMVTAYKKQIRRLFSRPEEHRLFWHGVIDQMFDQQFSFGDLYSLLQNQTDYVEHYAPAIAGQSLPRPVMILTSSDETAVTPGMQQRLLALYPGATVHRFRAGGHAPSLSLPGEYREVVISFLQGG